MKHGYASAVLGAHHEPDLDGLFDFVGDAAKAVGKAVGGAAKAVSHAAGDAVDAVDHVYVSATPQWLRKGIGATFGSTKFIWDSVDNIAHGQRIDRALIDAANNQIEIFRAVAPFAQLGLSFIPGVGQGVSAAIGAGLALAEGKPITDALIAGVAGTIPGGPLVQRAVDIGAHAVADLAAGKRIDEIALTAVRNNLPGGDAARMAFDTGLALAQGKKLQEVGLTAVSHLVPDSPLAQGAFEMTKRALAGHALEGSTRAAMKRLEAKHAPSPHGPAQRMMPRSSMAMRRRTIGPARSPAPVHSTIERVSTPMEPQSTSSSALPLVLGAAALAAAGGGAWWWMKHRRTP